MTDAQKPRLGAEGQVFVSLRAAEQWLDANDFTGIEEARRDLTELLLDAYRTDGDPELVRYRSKAQRLDLYARIAREGRLLVVVSVSPRDLVGSAGNKAARRRIVR